MRKLAIALVVGSVLTVGASPARAAIIGQFSWSGDDLFGPTFTFESLLPPPLGLDLFLDLRILTLPDDAVDPGLISFNPEGIDEDLDGTADRFISQLPLGIDLTGFEIGAAFLQPSLGTILLLDDLGNPLTDAIGGPSGLIGFGTVAQVDFVEPPAPVPEPGTILLLGTGVLGALARRRGFTGRR